MITGFYIKAEGHDNMFDYSACLYPEGVISSQETGVFNHDQIDQIIFKGYESEEEKEFKKRLYEAIKKVEETPSVPQTQTIEEIEKLSPSEFKVPVDNISESSSNNDSFKNVDLDSMPLFEEIKNE